MGIIILAGSHDEKAARDYLILVTETVWAGPPRPSPRPWNLVSIWCQRPPRRPIFPVSSVF